jgi:hypothetical protein
LLRSLRLGALAREKDYRVPIKSKDGITQILNGMEEDDHAKSQGRKEV